jgi:hypothetical protein
LLPFPNSAGLKLPKRGFWFPAQPVEKPVDSVLFHDEYPSMARKNPELNRLSLGEYDF